LSAIRVIFVDDEPRVLEGLKRMLRPKRNEWQMTFVGSAQAALEALRAEPCEVVVTDMRMPGMSGAELLEVVQREYPDTIRLILSGQAETESVMKALGVSHQFLSKPCDADILQGTIARAFALRDLAGNPAVKTLVARINKLPTLPATYQKLVECLKSPDADMDDVAQIIARDPSMSARLLKVVNSAYFGLAKPWRTWHAPAPCSASTASWRWCWDKDCFQAATRRRCRLQPRGAVDPQPRDGHGRASHRHRRRLDKEQVAAAFLAGMLHDIGKLVFAMGMPEEYARVLELARGRAGSERELEHWSCRPRIPTSAPISSASGACRTTSPKRSRFTKIRRWRWAVRPAGHRARRGSNCASPGIGNPHDPELHLSIAYLEATSGATAGMNGGHVRRRYRQGNPAQGSPS
jgi:DNA-binding NarL/FixJ family response regulator